MVENKIRDDITLYLDTWPWLYTISSVGIQDNKVSKTQNLQCQVKYTPMMPHRRSVSEAIALHNDIYTLKLSCPHWNRAGQYFKRLLLFNSSLCARSSTSKPKAKNAEVGKRGLSHSGWWWGESEGKSDTSTFALSLKKYYATHTPKRVRVGPALAGKALGLK